ncbi:MAG: DUF6351 family protein [Gemmatimonadota bacterium]
MTQRRPVALSTWIAMAVLPLVAIACSTADAENAAAELGPDELRLESVSTKPYLVTGGDVLLRVGVGAELDPSRVEIRANGETVEARSAPDGTLIALATGLPDGESHVEAAIPGGQSTTLELTSYPISGPIISGPHESPYLCQTEGFTLTSGESLGPALDDDCSIDTRVDYVYLSSSDGEFKTYPTGPAADRPSDVAETTTLDGETVPFVVRVQTGTVNRAIYQSAMLHDPADPTPDPWTRSRGWNGKLVYTHGGGCRNGWFRQGSGAGQVLNEGLLAMGFAVTSSSLNVFGNNCNDLLASETHIMVKERFVESYGVPIYTIGTGGSGGSYQSHQTADNYPGVFDGIIVSSSFPDVTSATIFTLADARLLWHYFNETAPGALTEEQERLVSGFGSHGSIANLSRGAARIDPTYDSEAPPEEQGSEVAGITELESRRYSPSNPDGIRATVYNHTANVYGYDESTGFAARPLDNRGVQYGLAVLESGDITADQFLALNRDIGGFDADLNHVSERHRADPTAVQRAIGTGRILYGGGGLASTPVIDFRSYTDHRPGGDIHMIVHQFTTRARLLAANGHADNHVMNVGGEWGYTADRPDLGNLFRSMDVWLMNLVAGDASGVSRAERVVAAKPADLVDNCWDTSGEQRRNIEEPLSFDSTGECASIYPAYETPRQVAGAPLTNDIVSCRLKPLDRADYGVDFTDAEWAELQAIFPEGVCDWSEGDAYADGYQGTWLSFGPSPVSLAR